MGKVDDQRAMREARYAASNHGAVARRPTAATRPVEAAADQPARTSRAGGPRAGQVTSADSTAPTATELCGHRSMGNKACTRERGHEATGTKNHRYG